MPGDGALLGDAATLDGHGRDPTADDTSQADDPGAPDTERPDTRRADLREPDGAAAPCPADMLHVVDDELRVDVCMDRFEAPNRADALPLVMYTFLDAEAWCQARDRRLCFDDEWTAACQGPDATTYPYGDSHQAGVCNDDEVWRTYNGDLLGAWPGSVSDTDVESLEQLLEAAAATGSAGEASADHVEWLYQGEPSGDNSGCTNVHGVFDLVGNVEEWTRRSDGGIENFHGNLKGRYWAESRTCQGNVRVHGDTFRFYEIGFRCCAEPE